AKGRVFLLVAAAFAAYAFVPSGLSAHLLAIFSRHGIEPETVVVIGALFGPSQVAARICEFALARNVHPLWVVRFALSVLLLAFLTATALVCFAVLRRPGSRGQDSGIRKEEQQGTGVRDQERGER